MVHKPSEDLPENNPSHGPRAPKAKLLFPDIDPKELPAILQVDHRTVAAIRQVIDSGLEGKEFLMNDTQATFVIEYIRYCLLQNLGVKKNLAAAALYFLRKQPSRDPKTLEVLQGSAVIVNEAKKLEGKEPQVITDSSSAEAPETTRAPAEKPNYLREAQDALKMQNYDDSAVLAAHAAGIPGATVESFLCAGICYTLCATKKPGSAESKIEDLGQALEYFETFMMQSKNNPKMSPQRMAIKAKIRDVSTMRTELIRKHQSKK